MTGSHGKEQGGKLKRFGKLVGGLLSDANDAKTVLILKLAIVILVLVIFLFTGKLIWA